VLQLFENQYHGKGKSLYYHLFRISAVGIAETNKGYLGRNLAYSALFGKKPSLYFLKLT
jgi:hypothetical protein